MKLRRQTLFFLLLAVLLMLLVACQEPPPIESWTGVSTVEGISSSVVLEVERREERLVGSYAVDAVRGSFKGALHGANLEAELIPSSSCSFTLSATITDASLAGDFEPLDCPGGKSGSWKLERQ